LTHEGIELTTTILGKKVSINGQRPYHHGDLRRSLIQAGSKLIEEKGLAGLSLREVARATGVINMRTAPRALKQSSWAAFHLVETLGKMVCELLMTGILKPN
jgi:hypothetical protein